MRLRLSSVMAVSRWQSAIEQRSQAPCAAVDDLISTWRVRSDSLPYGGASTPQSTNDMKLAMEATRDPTGPSILALGFAVFGFLVGEHSVYQPILFGLGSAHEVIALGVAFNGLQALFGMFGQKLIEQRTRL